MKKFFRFFIFIFSIGLIYWAVHHYDLRIKVPEPVEYQSAEEVIESIKGPIGAGVVHKEEEPQQEIIANASFEGSPDDIISLANEARKATNVAPLKKNERLMESARLKAQDMKEGEYFEHVSPRGLDMNYFVSEVDYRYSSIGENLAEGYFSAQEVHAAWMNSEGHRKNILSSDFEEIGVAVLQIEKKEGYISYISVQHFGTEFSPLQQEPAAAVVCDKKYKQICEDIEEQREEIKAVIEEQKEIIEDAEDKGASKKDLRAQYENLDKLEKAKDELKDRLEYCEQFIEQCDEWR